MSSVCYVGTNQRAFGTWPLKGQQCIDALSAALEAGYRAIDTAQMYGNEAEVGQVLWASGLPREAVFVTTKVHPDNFSEARFLPSVEASLGALGLDRVDLLLLHWPPVGGDVAPPLRLLSQARARGLTTHVGVSNYNLAMLRTARQVIDDPIVTNQVEFHPLLDQSRLLAGAAELGIPLSAYCSVARGKLFGLPLFAEIGAPYGKSAAQVALRWTLQKGVSLNTMSTKPENIRANFDVMDFTLSSVDMARIDVISRGNHRIVTRALAPWAPDWD